jgi:hypothetical protein
MFQQKCKLCGKERGKHKAVTLQCPIGMKSRIGYTSYSNQIFVAKATRKKKDTFEL